MIRGNEGIQNPFIASTSGFVDTLQNKPLDLGYKNGLKMLLHAKISLASIWIHVEAENTEPAEIALKVYSFHFFQRSSL